MGTDLMTFERLIERHHRLIDLILENTPGGKEEGAAKTTERFVEQVGLANERLGEHPSWEDDRYEVNAAHAYLSDASSVEDPLIQAALLTKANDHLNRVDETDYLG